MNNAATIRSIYQLTRMQEYASHLLREQVGARDREDWMTDVYQTRAVYLIDEEARLAFDLVLEARGIQRVPFGPRPEISGHRLFTMCSDALALLRSGA